MGLHKKRMSKRVSLHKKHKIEKKVRDHRRKMRKEGTGQKRLDKDPGIPNMHPFKEELMKQMERRKAKQDEEKERQKAQRQRQVQNKRAGSDPQQMQRMVRDAQKRAAEFDRIQEQTEAAGGTLTGSQRTFYKELKKVIDLSDVIVEVLDARDPLGCRCPTVERLIMEQSSGKKIVLLLNKIDLVPRDVVQAWLTYLRGFFPTIAFKASTQSQRQNLGQIAGDADQAPESLLKSAECLGASTLVSLLKNYCRAADIKTGVTVGIIGYPNVGKSSVINSLKRTKVASVGSTPGVTRQIQEVHLDKLVKLLDCPGIVFNSGSDVEAVLRNAIKVEQLEDPVTPVAAIVERCKREQLMELYNIPAFKDANDFIFLVAQHQGKFKKGGVPNIEEGAKIILKDWNDGRIKYFTIPPEKKGVQMGAQVVSQYGAEFSVESIAADEQNTLASLPQIPGQQFMAMESAGLGQDLVMDEDSDAEDSDADDYDELEEGSSMSDDDDSEQNGEDDDSEGSGMEESDAEPAAAAAAAAKPAAKGKRVQPVERLMTADEKELNPRSNQLRKKALKEQKKGQRKAAAAAMEDDDDSYSLSKHYGIMQ